MYIPYIYFLVVTCYHAGIFKIEDCHASVSICPHHRESYGIQWRCGKVKCCVPSQLAGYKSAGVKGDRGINSKHSAHIFLRHKYCFQSGHLSAISVSIPSKFDPLIWFPYSFTVSNFSFLFLFLFLAICRRCRELLEELSEIVQSAPEIVLSGETGSSGNSDQGAEQVIFVTN